jgi:hypothetical protein
MRGMDPASVLIAVGVFFGAALLSAGLFILLVLLLPRHYFAAHHWRALDKRPIWVRSLSIAAKNLLGLAIIALGILLSIPGIPGQGVLTILIGVLLLDIPGKHRLVRWIAARPGVLRGLNRLRAAFARPPLELN